MSPSKVTRDPIDVFLTRNFFHSMILKIKKLIEPLKLKPTSEDQKEISVPKDAQLKIIRRYCGSNTHLMY